MGKKREEESGGSWMDTYGDMVTLLLTFFVMLYSQSTVADDKWNALVSAFRADGEEKIDVISFVKDGGGNSGDGNYLGTFESDEPYQGTLYNSAIEQLYDKIQTYIEDSDMANSILMELTTEGEETAGAEGDDGDQAKDGGGDKDKPSNGETETPNPAKNISIQFRNNVLFEPDKAVIKEESIPTLQFLGECLASVKDDISMIIIKGHTAISPTSQVDTRLLSAERAGTISNFFEKNSGISSTQLVPIGLGSDYPIASNDNEEGRMQNRRVGIVIINKNSELGKSKEFLKAMGASFDVDDPAPIDSIVK